MLPLVEFDADPVPELDCCGPVMVKLRIEVGELATGLLLSEDVLCIELRPRRPMKLLRGFSFFVVVVSVGGSLRSLYEDLVRLLPRDCAKSLDALKLPSRGVEAGEGTMLVLPSGDSVRCESNADLPLSPEPRPWCSGCCFKVG